MKPVNRLELINIVSKLLEFKLISDFQANRIIGKNDKRHEDLEE